MIKSVNLKNVVLGGLMTTSAVLGGVAVKQNSDLNKVQQELNYYKEAEQNDRYVSFALGNYVFNQITENMNEMIQRDQGTQIYYQTLQQQKRIIVVILQMIL